MKQNGDGTAAKIDVIICRSRKRLVRLSVVDDPKEMRDQFMSISDGMYADLLFEKFGQERVEKELDKFLGLDFFPRVGGGIGITRLLHAMNNYSCKTNSC